MAGLPLAEITGTGRSASRCRHGALYLHRWIQRLHTAGSTLTDDRMALLALGMNDEPLPLEHGFPVRMVVPGLYGYVSATKWVVDLEVGAIGEKDAYWTTRGWSGARPYQDVFQSRCAALLHEAPAGRSG